MKLNNKGIAITVILYAMVILVIAIFTLLLATVKSRYKVQKDIKNSINNSINNPMGIQYIDNTKCIEELVYNGKDQVLIDKNDKVKYSNAKGKNAGTYNITGTAEDYYYFNDKSKKETITCSIEKGTPTIVLENNVKEIENGVINEFTYNADVEGTFNITSNDTGIAKVKMQNGTCIVTGFNTTDNEKLSTNIIVNFVPNDTDNYTTTEIKYKITVYNKCVSGIVCQE